MRLAFALLYGLGAFSLFDPYRAAFFLQRWRFDQAEMSAEGRGVERCAGLVAMVFGVATLFAPLWFSWRRARQQNKRRVTAMDQEKRIFDGVLFCPGDPKLRAIKGRSHRLSALYSRTMEEETDTRNELLSQILGAKGEGVFMTGPIFFHYGVHTRVGDRFFANYNLTVQDDAPVTIGNDCNFGPNVTIVTPVHPLLPDERRTMLDEDGKPSHLCYAQPVTIGNDVWLCANVTVCPGVTIGDGCVIGAGSVVTHDIPPRSVAAGVPCRVIRTLSEADSMVNYPELLGGCSVLPEE